MAALPLQLWCCAEPSPPSAYQFINLSMPREMISAVGRLRFCCAAGFYAQILVLPLQLHFALGFDDYTELFRVRDIYQLPVF